MRSLGPTARTYFFFGGVALGVMLSGVSSMVRSEEHTSELQSQSNLVCRLLLEKKKRSEPYLLEELAAVLVRPERIVDREHDAFYSAALQRGEDVPSAAQSPFRHPHHAHGHMSG